MDRENKEINAVHERDLDNLLQRLGVKDKFDAGEFLCKFCKEAVTKENLYSILPESGGINFVCDKPACVIAFTEYTAEKEKNKPE
ncbi:MAG: hypothetical protein A2418_02895 [Candidatus Brennerbacteria bacterium RIFOXYC1_FULL_41_11]|nr:MAG: hypothetical protein A2391_00440 [Candidatus Brennerbacteria bacterium RIFOXYB1_FULL_41_13]OGY40448.1 MAG: hypothetical protein A2418_02895 [Candidatus Brennerbacteria bacterium RIFOXYC1_FULL_41_11]